MLYSQKAREFVPWSRGSALLFLDQEQEHSTSTLPMAVRCRFGPLPEELALLDTGAQWTIIGPETVELLGGELSEGFPGPRMSTRFGPFSETTIHRLTIALLADQGETLIVDGTCLALHGWPGPNILGVHGFLERLRFAVDPGDMHVEARIHFGPA